jgi:hypothetical protein
MRKSPGLPSADRYVSPDGNRIALIDRDSGEVWLTIRQTIPEAAAILRDIKNWTPLRPTSEGGARPTLTVVH